jgi:hypothetical protein
MVQGWRRYSWEKMTGTEDFEIKHLPERGIETKGQVVTFNLLNKQTPKPKVDVNLLLHKKWDNDYYDTDVNYVLETFVTDYNGRFSFVSDAEGRWKMLLSINERAKLADRIILDRFFSPEPRRYDYSDLQVSIAENNIKDINEYEETDEYEDYMDYFDYESLLAAYNDSLSRLGLSIEERLHLIPQITVRAKRTREQDIFHNRSTSVAYYDVASEYDDIYDNGEFVGNGEIHQFLLRLNRDFLLSDTGYSSARASDIYYTIDGSAQSSAQFVLNIQGEVMLYKGRLALFVINNEIVDLSNEIDMYRYQRLNILAIKDIYINENIDVIAQYIIPPPLVSKDKMAQAYSCVVFIETYPDDQIPAEGANGVRKTWLEGYSPVKEFYSPNYSTVPQGLIDYRRTLYWNPMVTTDKNGKAKIQFYNNSSAINFNISAETVTPIGLIGVNKKE